MVRRAAFVLSFALAAFGCGAQRRAAPLAAAETLPDAAPTPAADSGRPPDAAEPEPTPASDAAPSTAPDPYPHTWPEPSTSPPDAPSGPLPPPQPSAAGVLEACAFEPAADAPLGASSVCPGGVFRGDLRIDSPEAADAVAGCTRIEGSVEMIDGDAALANLALVRVITGDFRILVLSSTCSGKGAGGANCEGRVSPDLSLAPLRSLRCVGGDFAVGSGPGSPVSIDLSPLGSLVEVGGNLGLGTTLIPAEPPFASLQRVWGTITLMEIGWLPALETVYGGILAHSPVSTSSIVPVEKAQLPGLRYMGCGSDDPPCRDGVLGCTLSASTDASLAGYDRCALVLGDVELRGPEIADLSRLAALRAVKGRLRLESTNLEDLHALAELDRVAGVKLERNPRLRDVAGLDGVALESIEVRDNDLLRDLSTWRSLRPIGDVGVNLQGSPALETIGEWPWLVRASSFLVRGDGLTSLGRFDNLSRVAMFSLGGVSKLTDAGSFPSLQSADQIVISNATALTRLPAFPSLSSRVLRLQITGSAIRDLRGLEQVPHAEEITISDSSAPTSLDGLTALSAVAGRFSLHRNPLLRSLHGLTSLMRVADLWVSENPLLTDCEVQWLAGRVNRPGDSQRFSGNGGPGPCAAP